MITWHKTLTSSDDRAILTCFVGRLNGRTLPVMKLSEVAREESQRSPRSHFYIDGDPRRYQKEREVFRTLKALGLIDQDEIESKEKTE